jgi:hypothetical protein
MRWAKRYLGPLVLILGLTFLLCEAILRIAGISHLTIYKYDECCGYTLRPGYEGWYRGEGEAYLIITPDGFRDRERLRKKPDNTVRIAVLGDSNVEALQIPLEDTFCQVMERELASCGDKKIEVINFGVGGYGTTNELLLLKYRVWQYSPDIVVLCFTSGNDLLDNAARYQQYLDILKYYRGKNSYADMNFIKYKIKVTALKIRDFFTSNFYSVQAVYKLKAEIEKRAQMASARNKSLHPLLKEEGLKNEVYREPDTPFWKDAWALTEKLILEMRDEVRRHGVEFLVVTMVTYPQCYPDPATRRELLRLLDVEDLFYPDYRLKKLGEKEGFEVYNLAPLFQAYAEEHQVYLAGFKTSPVPGRGHLNAEGNRLAGKILARNFCQLLQKNGLAKNKEN